MNEPFDHLLKVRTQLPSSCPLRILLTYGQSSTCSFELRTCYFFPLTKQSMGPQKQLSFVLTGPSSR